MMATLLVSGFVSRLCLAGLELDFLVPEHVAAARNVPGRLFVRNRKWFMPSFSIRVEAVQERESPTLEIRRLLSSDRGRRYDRGNG